MSAATDIGRIDKRAFDLVIARSSDLPDEIADTAWAMSSEPVNVSRRDLLSLIGAVSGSAAMYQAMTSLGFAADSGYKGPVKLEGDPKGASVLILGAGLAGMTAALELRKAGYKVQVLEYNSRAGGRNWTLRGGDTFTELGGATQNLRVRARPLFQSRPVAHSLSPPRAARLLQAPRRRAGAVHPGQPQRASCTRSTAFGGKPQRIRDIKADFQGHVAELLAKVTQQGKLDEAVTKEDQEMLMRGAEVVGRA